MEMQFACKSQQVQSQPTTDLKIGDLVRRKRGDQTTGTIERIEQVYARASNGSYRYVLKATVRWNGHMGWSHRTHCSKVIVSALDKVAV